MAVVAFASRMLYQCREGLLTFLPIRRVLNESQTGFFRNPILNVEFMFISPVSGGICCLHLGNKAQKTTTRTLGMSFQIKTVGNWSWLLTPFSSEVKNGGVITPLQHISLQIVELNGFSFPGIKRSGIEADYLPPFSVEVKIGGVITPLQHILLQLMELNYLSTVTTSA